MNIYFSCSITGGRQDQEIYQIITNILLDAGHVVPTAHLAKPNVIDVDKLVQPQDVFLRDSNWVHHCDALVAEVTTPSHGVGYEIALALSLKKPVMCCYQKGVRVSKMLTGNTMPGFHQLAYANPQELREGLLIFLKELSSNQTI
ncbi:MAG: nucleoside 2-deoxyribosyltransferase [Anaerolineaceae bacterium]|nr:nucleoside 2-deoxyribosyltransferase [Anaerolineaceae bacterium]MBN2677126.1 nucleoside 2-deoxyribosyltransferase [Anaerolineaceae bacterium]